MERNKLSEDEMKLFTRCLNAEQSTLSHEELQAALPNLDVVEKMNVINSLISRDMLLVKRLKDKLLYMAVDQAQRKINSNMSPDEKLIYDCISGSGNTGMWTKTIQTRTTVHQSNMNKILKSLQSKNLIKSVKSVEFPTRQIYMLSKFQPSIELSGGSWYTGNKLNTELIGLLLQSIHQYLRYHSFPPNSSSAAEPCKILLYPTSHTPYLPTTVHDVLDYLKQTQVIPEGTDLTTAHILDLLNVLLYDGAIERIMVETAKCEGEPDPPADSTSDLEDYPSGSNTRKRNPKGHKQSSSLNAHKRMRFNAEKVSSSRSTNKDSDTVIECSTKSRRRKMLPDDEQYIYRALHPLMNRLQEKGEVKERADEDLVTPPPKSSGACDMPCGHCPSFDLCFSKGKAWQSCDSGSGIGLAGIRAGLGAWGRFGAMSGVAPVNPAECVYFDNWFSQLSIDDDDQAKDKSCDNKMEL